MNTTIFLKILAYNIKKETITENITLLDYFLDLINKSLNHTKSILLTCIYMTADFPVLVTGVSIKCCDAKINGPKSPLLVKC